MTTSPPPFVASPMRRRVTTTLAAATLLAALPAAAQRFEVRPGPELPVATDPVAIVLDGLAPGSEITLRSQRRVREWSGAERPYAAEAVYRAGTDGRIDLATAVPLRAPWSGADLRGLFWSMTPAEGVAAAELQPNQVRLQALHEGRVVAEQLLTLRDRSPQVQRRAAEPFPGAVFATLPGGGRRPALILLGGSEGGSMITFDAPAWASRGYAVLALPYYSPPRFGPQGPMAPELPALPPAFADIPVDRLQAAHDWLAAQPEVDAERIGIVGTSKGAEFALLAGLRFPWLRAVAGIVPSDVVWEGWGPGVEPGRRASFAWKGEPYAFVPYVGMADEVAGFSTGREVRLRRPQDRGRAAAGAERVAAARIPVERIAAPVFVAGAHDDQVWDSGSMTEAIAEARRRAGRETVALVFRDAGHALGGHGWSPTTQYNAGPSKMGGTPEANARAQAEVVRELQAFLRRTLGPLPQ
ncbi:MAG: acyl-CoA thioesterase/BAAT N-terminal domain-containing protein [Rubrivivax sp.]|nr:acyl-CoA thioesterase/BAAT N-terminal domain-containing protein [Rubrivivax sp.]